jgi:hypothetical protein
MAVVKGKLLVVDLLSHHEVLLQKESLLEKKKTPDL